MKIRRAGVVAALAILALSFGAISASAHADLLGSDPRSGATLSSAPTHITLTYSERVDADLSVVTVLDTHGSDVHAATPAAVANDPRQLSIALPPDLPDGVYTVNWRAVSSDDGHVTAGAFAFGIGAGPVSAPRTVPPPESPGPSVLGVSGKVLLYAGLAVLFAVGFVGSLAFGGDVPARRAVLVIASSVAVVGAIAMLLAEQHVVGVGLGALLRSDVGTPYLWLLSLVAATATASAWAETARNRLALPLVGAGAAGAMLVRAAGGHAAAATSASWLQIGAQWFHFMSVGAWVGGLILVLVLLRSRARAGEAAPVNEVKRFSTIAFWAVLVLAATGGIRAVNELGGVAGVGHLLSSSYGTTLAVKVGIAVILVALGGFNRFRSIPRLTDDGRLFRRVLGAELLASLALFGFTGTLTSLPPATDRSTALAGAPAGISASGSDFATTTRIVLHATPGTAGSNEFVAVVTDYDSGAPANATSVELHFQPKGSRVVGTSSLSLRHTRGSTWIATGTNLSLDGTWSVLATITGPNGNVQIPLTLSTRSPPQQISVSRAAGQPDIYTISLPAGVELQSYIDPGTAGPSQFHVTALQNGAELALSSAILSATPTGGDVRILVSTRLSAGHFVANTALPTGDWRFGIAATTKGGRTLLANFNETIGAP